MTDVVHKPDPGQPAVPSPEINFALVLSRMIDSVQQDPAELRATVYELARVKLLEQVGQEDATEVKRLVGALEEAITGVEAFSRQESEQKLRAAIAISAPGSADGALHTLAGPEEGPGAAQGSGTFGERATARSAPSATGQRLLALGAVGRLAVLLIALFAVGTIAYMWPRWRSQVARFGGGAGGMARSTTDSNPPSPNQGSAPTDTASGRALVPNRPPLPFPLPSTFGIFAVSDGQLRELKPLPGRVPDARVAVSAAIVTPSETTLADVDPKFLVFRRDGAANAPDHVDVRFVAKVTRAMGVDGSGKAKIAPAPDSWVIRNITIPYKVGPVDDHPEMFLIQAETADAKLPAGRYVVVVKGQGYDFTIDGAATDPRQCMERVDAVNGTFYSPCR